MSETPAKKTRKVRRDKGLRLLTSRDLWVLRSIGEQGGISVDQLQALLSREPGHRNRKAPGPNGLSASAVSQVLSRWMEAPALVTYERLYVDEPGWVQLTIHAERALERSCPDLSQAEPCDGQGHYRPA
jgi:hypothetical protein